LTEANANTYVSAYRSACENVGGGGATFSGGVSTDELNISDSTWTYCAKYSCNGCTSVEIQAQKQAVIDSCTTECFTSNFTCSATGALSYQVNISGCSETPITTGECAESSSSIESSSSGESSSSVASSSSVEEGSSASEPGSSTSVHSSASTSVVQRMSDICYFHDYSGSCVLASFDAYYNSIFTAIPPMDGTPTYGDGYCSDGYFSFYTNIPKIYHSSLHECWDSSCEHNSPIAPYVFNQGTLTDKGVAPFSGNQGFNFYGSSLFCVGKST